MGIIRLLLALAVLLEHSFYTFHTTSFLGITLPNGETAVQSFFILSGFYISFILNEKYIGINDSYKLFITNRILRLYPIYISVLSLIILSSLAYCFYTNFQELGHFKLFAEYYHQMNFSGFIYLILTNLFIIGQDIVMFLGLNTENGSFYFTQNFRESNPMLAQFLLIPQAWTLSLEIIFYLIAPFILKRNHKVVLLLLFCSLSIRLFLISKGLDFDPWSYRFFPNELCFFFAGNLSYRLYKKIEFKNIDKKYLSSIFLFIIISILFFNKINFVFKSEIYFISFAIAVPFIFILFKNLKFDQTIGDLSYPVYLSHMFIMIFVARVPLSNPTIKICLVIFSTLLFSLLLNKVVAGPIERIRQKRLS